jgi:hypothetical protein
MELPIIILLKIKSATNELSNWERPLWVYKPFLPGGAVMTPFNGSPFWAYFNLRSILA